jgi:hypothetical protein
MAEFATEIPMVFFSITAGRGRLGFRRANCYNRGFTPSGRHSIHEPGGEMKIETPGQFFNTEQIEELVLAIATANLTNRFNEGMKTPVDV